ncbi:transglycosylase SLT domain-containing protein [Massilia sp. Se16.2.3]|uniref:lytic transglycosylase domain-containing protein n=1 Tax=Massilia sp. Se16.2.3 TaxID=2709303 RepID=UPI001E5B4E15|nr:transglycosylase SLT domain-containing protein [Massilia sp. Se16.2.3]
MKFYQLRLRPEGNREWNWALRSLSERQLLAAAEYARRNELLERMVETSLRTRTEFDYSQRFPAPHNEILQPTARNLSLDAAWVYGLIRQESRFISEARSGVGAAGLMQVMPATGKWVAAKIGLGDFVHSMLHDVRTNITLGTNYMNMVLENAGGSQVLATAAYNAGPVPLAHLARPARSADGRGGVRRIDPVFGNPNLCTQCDVERYQLRCTVRTAAAIAQGAHGHDRAARRQQRPALIFHCRPWRGTHA